jgi:hypothetical protein
MDSKRVLEIILEESGRVEERYEGYRNDLTEVVAEIVSIERQHKLMARNVKKDVAAQVNTLGGDLAGKLAAAEQTA